MTLTDRSGVLVKKIDAISKMPLLMRATYAAPIILEAACLLVELSARSEQSVHDAETMRARLARLETLHAQLIEKQDGLRLTLDA